MKSETWIRVFEVFRQAVAIDEAERAAFLDSICSADADIRVEVERLLAEDAKPGGLLDLQILRPVSDLEAEGSTPPRRIGPFEIEREIASGGMGTVYEAVQDEPRRRVALKLMWKGLRSSAALRRFRFESEILARLHHPGIAQVYASGTHAEDGREIPYFALELVEGGADILTHARTAELSMRGKVELFLDVCEAVHHGHQRGVIHRDLKPGNVLVDGAGRVKVIDFGVARIADDESTRATLPGQVVGTLQFMSPEQLAGKSTEVDTRSDVYSLGCILYELLGGQPPFDLSALDIPAAALLVQQQEPLLPRNVPVELGWICLTCLEKEPDRRFAAVNELAEDLRRFLRHEPVTAGPPSGLYRVRKFVRRQRVLLAAVAAVIAALALGLVRAEREARATEREFERAEQERATAWRVAESLRKTLTAVGPLVLGPDASIVDVLAEAAKSVDEDYGDLPEAKAMVQNIVGKSYLDLRQFDEANEHLGAAVAFVEESLERDDPLTIDVLAHRAQFLFLIQDWQGGEELAREVEALALERFGRHHEVTLRIQGTLAELLLATRKLEEAEERYEAHIGDLEAFYGPDHEELIGALGGRALVWKQQGKLQAALAELERVALLAESTLVEDHFRVWNARLNLVGCLFAMEEYERAEELQRECLAHLRERYGDRHEFTAGAFSRLGNMLQAQGRAEESLPYHELALDASIEIFGDSNIRTLLGRRSFARALIDAGDLEFSEVLLREIIAGGVGHEHESTFMESLMDLLFLMNSQGRQDEAIELMVRVYEERRALADGTFVERVLLWLINQLQISERAEEAERISREALAFHEPRVPEGHYLVPRIRQLIGTSLAFQDRREEADDVLRTAFAEARDGGHDELVRDILINIAHNLLELGRYEDAEQVYEAERDASDDWTAWVDDQLAHLREEHAPAD